MARFPLLNEWLKVLLSQNLLAWYPLLDEWLKLLLSEKPTGLVSVAGRIVRPGPSITPRPTSLAINIVTSGSDPGFASSFQKSTVQVTSNANSHSQTKSTEPIMSTAVVYTVKPRLPEVRVQHEENKKQNFLQSSNSDATVGKATYVLTRTGQSLETPVSNTFQQSQPLEAKSAPSGLPLKAVSPSQTNSRQDSIREKQQTVLQQRELLRQQETSYIGFTSPTTFN